MRSLRQPRKYAWMLLLLVLSMAGLPARLTWAQGAVGRIIVLGTRLEHFPEYRIWARFVDSYGKPLSQVVAGDLQLLENEQTLTIQGVRSISGPVQLIFVFDAGAGITADVYKGQSRAAWMQEAALQVVQQMAPDDAGGLIVVTPGGVQVLQALTTDKDVLAQAITNWKPVSPTGNQKLSAGLAGVQQAIFELSKASEVPRLVLLFSGGIQGVSTGVQIAEREQEVLRNARQNDVAVYVVHLRWETDPTHERSGYSRLAPQSRGAIYRPNNFKQFFEDLRPWRAQFEIVARSKTAEQQRNLTLQWQPQPEIMARWDVTLPDPVRPPAVSLVVNEGQDHVLIRQEGDVITPDTLPVEVHVQWQDPYPRQIARLEILADGQPVGPALQDIEATRPVRVQWKVSPETTTVLFEAVVVDELGLQAQANRSLTLEFQRALSPGQMDIMCRLLAKIPSVGESVANVVCVQLGLSLGNVIAISIGAVALVLLYRKREAVGAVVEKTVEVTQAFVERVTKTFGRQRVKARLILEAGGDEDGQLPKTIDLTGDTTIGRDAQYADIIINRPAISRLHCSFHEDPASGKWYLEDKESTNGTFLNDQRLEPLKPTPLKTGDLIDVAPLYRGGVRFRFEQLEESIDITDASYLEDEVGVTQTLDHVDETETYSETFDAAGNLPPDLALDDDDVAITRPDAWDGGPPNASSRKALDDDFDPTRAEF